VFYPLYPMFARGLAAIGGLTPADALLLVSNAAGLLAIVALFKLVREEFGDQLALTTTALLSFFPTSVLLSAGYTEPLELLLVVSFFLALKQNAICQQHCLQAWQLLADQRALSYCPSFSGRCGSIAIRSRSFLPSCHASFSRHRASGNS
jgi:Gpi18-like mannosyltransferase